MSLKRKKRARQLRNKLGQQAGLSGDGLCIARLAYDDWHLANCYLYVGNTNGLIAKTTRYALRTKLLGVNQDTLQWKKPEVFLTAELTRLLKLDWRPNKPGVSYLELLARASD